MEEDPIRDPSFKFSHIIVLGSKLISLWMIGWFKYPSKLHSKGRGQCSKHSFKIHSVIITSDIVREPLSGPFPCVFSSQTTLFGALYRRILELNTIRIMNSRVSFHFLISSNQILFFFQNRGKKEVQLHIPHTCCRYLLWRCRKRKEAGCWWWISELTSCEISQLIDTLWNIIIRTGSWWSFLGIRWLELPMQAMAFWYFSSDLNLGSLSFMYLHCGSHSSIDNRTPPFHKIPCEDHPSQSLSPWVNQ